MRIGPITDEMGAERIRQSRKNFADAAFYVRHNPPPIGTHPAMWIAHGDACESMVEEMDEALADWDGQR